MVTFQELFTPVFICLALFIFIGGLAIIQFIDRIFVNSKNRNGVRLFCLAIIINIIILLFLVMSFSKVKFQEGRRGPKGNKGYKGDEGKAGSLQNCKPKTFNVGEKKALDRAVNYIDIKPPLLNED
jgi:hypothetical protein